MQLHNQQCDIDNDFDALGVLNANIEKRIMWLSMYWYALPSDLAEKVKEHRRTSVSFVMNLTKEKEEWRKAEITGKASDSETSECAATEVFRSPCSEAEDR